MLMMKILLGFTLKLNSEEAKLFVHCSLLVTFCSLHVFCSFLNTFCLLLVTFSSIVYDEGIIQEENEQERKCLN